MLKYNICSYKMLFTSTAKSSGVPRIESDKSDTEEGDSC
jgi:hypothetical protein